MAIQCHVYREYGVHRKKEAIHCMAIQCHVYREYGVHRKKEAIHCMAIQCHVYWEYGVHRKKEAIHCMAIQCHVYWNKGFKVVYTYVMTVFFSCDKADFSSTQNSMVDTNLKGRITLIRYLVFEIYTMHVPHSQEEGCHFEWVERREEDINENFEGDALQTCAHLCHCTRGVEMLLHNTVGGMVRTALG